MKKSLLTIAALTGTLALIGATQSAFAAIDTVTPTDQQTLADNLAAFDQAAAKLDPAAKSEIANIANIATTGNNSDANKALIFQALTVISNDVGNGILTPTDLGKLATHTELLQSSGALTVVSSNPTVAKSEKALTVLDNHSVAEVVHSKPINGNALGALASQDVSNNLHAQQILLSLKNDEKAAKTLFESVNPVNNAPVSTVSSQSTQATTNQTIARLDALQLEKILALYRSNRGSNDTPQGPAGPTSRTNSRPEPGVWGSFIGSTANQGEINGDKGYSFDTKGVMFGYDRNLSPTVLLGINAGYTNTDTSMDAGVDANNTAKSTSVSLYANQTFTAKIHANYGLTLAGGDIDNSHKVNGDTVTSTTASHTYSLFSQVAYDLVEPKYLLSPLFRAQVSRNKVDGYTESGSTLGLNAIVDDDTTNFFSTALGVNGVYFLNEKVDLKGRVRWTHEWSGDLQPVSSSYFSGSAPSFTQSQGIDLGRNRYTFALGAKYDLTKLTSLDFDYEVELAQAYVSQTGVAKLKYQF